MSHAAITLKFKMRSWFPDNKLAPLIPDEDKDFGVSLVERDTNLLGIGYLSTAMMTCYAKSAHPYRK